MTKPFKPLLADNKEYKVSDLTYPLLASYKLDGIRACVVDGKLVTRSLKPIPNQYIREYLSQDFLSGLDGELISGKPNSPIAYRTSVSAVMKETGTPQFIYYVFDDFTNIKDSFNLRLTRLKLRVEALGDGIAIRVLEQRLIHSEAELLAYEAGALSAGFEGLILRKPSSLYKYGRSTFNEGSAIKLKRMLMDEAEIIGITELMQNMNPAFLNELGHTTHTSHQENLVGKGVMGALHVRDLKTGVEFYIGTGFTDKEREDFYNKIHLYMGEIISYSHFPVGGYDKPRFPAYRGFRDPVDMSE